MIWLKTWLRGTPAALVCLLPITVGAQPAPSDVIERYCTNIRDAAIDARTAWQASELARMEQRVALRVEELEARKADLETLIEKRQALYDSGNSRVARIYAGMRAEAAAEQLSEIMPSVAAAVLAQLDPRAASAILTEMEPRKAAALTVVLAGPLEEVAENGGQIQ